MLKTDTIQITPELLVLIAEVDEFKGAWRALGTLAPERLKALRHVATVESIGSSTRIEGSKLTDREVERLLANLEIKKFSTRDEQEVAGYAEVMETIFQAWKEIPITENHIKQLHRDLLCPPSLVPCTKPRTKPRGRLRAGLPAFLLTVSLNG
jgi:Fic family protein